MIESLQADCEVRAGRPLGYPSPGPSGILNPVVGQRREANVNPSDRDRNDHANGAPHGGTDEPRHQTGRPGKATGGCAMCWRPSEIILIIDPDGTLRYASPAFDRILGYDSEEASAR